MGEEIPIRLAQAVFHIVQGMEHLVAEVVFAQMVPEMLDRIQSRRKRGHADGEDGVGPRQLLDNTGLLPLLREVSI